MGFDYSRFDKIDASDSEGSEHADAQEKESACIAKKTVAALPPELSPELSLVLAARHGQANVVEALLDSGVSPDSCDPHGVSALLGAVECGVSGRPVIELLLMKRASIDLQSKSGETPLGRAAAVGPNELVAALLAGNSPAVGTLSEALVAASRAGNQGCADLLLQNGASANTSYDGRLPLTCCAERDDLNAMGRLVEAKADINALDGRGCSPLACAVKRNCVSAVRWLCKSRADVESKTSTGCTPLVTACENANAIIVNLLLEHEACPQASKTESVSRNVPTPIVAAASAGSAEVCHLLLQARADATVADACGRRPLTCAAATSSVSLCQRLISEGAPVNGLGTSGAFDAADAVSRGCGVTALSIATAAGDIRLTAVLLQAGADTEIADERGVRPLAAAALRGSADLCRQLLVGSARVDAPQEETEKTALIFAAGIPNGIEVCRVLLESGADPKWRASTGTTPLHAAAANGHVAACKVLIDSRADPLMEGPGGSSAIAMARSAGHPPELLEALEGAGM